MGRSFQVDSGLLKDMWPVFYDTAVYLLNRLPTKSLDWKTPMEKLYEMCGYLNVKPYADHFRGYGCLSYVYDRKDPAGDKIRPRAIQRWLVGYTASNIWNLYRVEGILICTPDRSFAVLGQSSAGHTEAAVLWTIRCQPTWHTYHACLQVWLDGKSP